MNLTTERGRGAASASDPISGSTNKFKPLTIGYAGDSISVQWSDDHGLSPMWWFTNHFYPCRTKNTFNSAVGGTLSSNLLIQEGINPPQIDALEALTTKPDLLIIQTLQNDFYDTYEKSDAGALNVTTYCDRALIAGVGNVIISGHPPKVGTDDASALEYLNRILSSYADNTEGVHFIDVLSLWRAIPTVEDSADSGINWRSGYSTDGVHPLSKAMYEAGELLTPILQPLVQSKSIQPTTASDYDNTNAPYNNLLGPNGLMIGTNGDYNGVTNANVAGVSTSSLNFWEVTDENGITATPSIITGDDGYSYQQIVLSGTASANADVYIKFPFAFNPITLGDFIQEGKLHLNDITNVEYIRFGTDNISQPTINSSGQDLTGNNEFHITAEASYEQSDWSTRTFTLRVRVNSGETPTGTIQLGRCGIYRVVE